MTFTDRLGGLKSAVDTYIQNYLGDMGVQLRKPGLDKLFESVSYSLAAGGHRIRPVLSILTAEALGKNSADVMALGAAVELIHTYSLIHDDLPCMDDDDMRRGKPSNHKVFGEAIAVLAGDALCTEAFLLLANKYSDKPETAVALVSELGLAAGAYGMVGGQAVDISFRGRNTDTAEIEFLHTYKTGALFKTSVLGAARVCGANAFELKCLSDYARAFGLIFQIADDIADGTETDEPSFVKSVGIEKARETCRQLVMSAQQAVEPLGPKAEGLKQLVSYLYERTPN